MPRAFQIALAAGVCVGAALVVAGLRATRAASPGSRVTTQPTSSAALTLRDYAESPVIDPAESRAGPLRIVSLAPNVTEMCAALGLADQLVGRTRFCLHPPRVQRAKSLGGVQDLNAETLLSLKPDLVLIKDQSGGLPDRLASLDLHFETVPDTRLDDVFVGIRKIGALTDRNKSAESLCTALHTDLARVRAAHPPTSPLRVLFVTGVLPDPPAPPYVAGPGSYFDDLLRLAGHQNAAAGAKAYGALSLETILTLNPDAIIELDDRGQRPGGDAQARRIWRGVGPLKAVASGRVRVISGSQHFVPGPRMAQTLLAVCCALEQHGD